jgi:hypothetical protein
MSKTKTKIRPNVTYHLVVVRPRFSMPKELVSKFKSKGYKWVQRETWVLEKADCLDVAAERDFIKGFGEQRWEVSISSHVGQRQRQRP